MQAGGLTRWALALGLAFLVPVGLAWAGIPVRLGAHPWWAVQTAAIGGGIGAVAGAVLAPVPALWRGMLGAVAMAGAGCAAWDGKTRFAASFAEDAQAGQFWYAGWIGVAAGLALLTASVLSPGRRSSGSQSRDGV